jgi:hypothetical protein
MRHIMKSVCPRSSSYAGCCSTVSKERFTFHMQKEIRKEPWVSGGALRALRAILCFKTDFEFFQPQHTTSWSHKNGLKKRIRFVSQIGLKVSISNAQKRSKDIFTNRSKEKVSIFTGQACFPNTPTSHPQQLQALTSMLTESLSLTAQAV